MFSKYQKNHSMPNLRPSTLFVIIVLLAAACRQTTPPSEILFDPARSEKHLIKSLNNDRISTAGGWLEIDFVPRDGNSSIAIYPIDDFWDGSGFRFVRCEVENPGREVQLVELGFGNYDLTLGATLVPPGGKKTLKAVIYRTDHPAYIDNIFPVMHGKPDGILRGWMATTSDSIEFLKLTFPAVTPGNSIRIGKIWLEEPYVLMTENELKNKYYPFIDRFGQYMYGNWPDKINDESDLHAFNQKELIDLATHPKSPEWNKYGGWENGPELLATGRFRVEKHEGKWWFVDPEGKLFWSNGFDCVEFGRQTRTLVTGRESYFSYLPSEESPEFSHYGYESTVNQQARVISFHTLNLYRKYGDAWREIASEQVHRRLHSWGFNTIGNWSDNRIYTMRKTPYVLTVNTRRTGVIADPYLPGFKNDLIELLAARQEEMNDPWCIGIFIDNELKWGVKWGHKIAEQIQEAPETQPAKMAFVGRMGKKYILIDALNKAWGTSFGSWEDVSKCRDIIPGAESDMKEFMNEFASLYHSICRDAVKSLVPDLLYMGSRMDFHLYPEDSSLNDIIRIASEYCDVVSFNRYRYTCAELVPPDGGDYPIIIGEYHFGTLETGLLQPGLMYAADQDERAELFGHYLKSAIENPYIIGAHWFQLVDQSVAGRGDGENYQAGFLTVGDVTQQEMVEESRKIGYNMYKIRAMKK
jgi:hypothetical protein